MSHTSVSNAYAFVEESNRIEGILREPTLAEVEEHVRFMALESVHVEELARFVAVYQPDARLRVSPGLNVRVGSHYPPPGGPAIGYALEQILVSANESGSRREGAYALHQKYEQLHPFTDGNGRSGRMLWMWMMREAPLGFLHTWYYQSLANSPERD